MICLILCKTSHNFQMILPFLLTALYPLPERVPVSQPYGLVRHGRTHKGIDLIAPIGTPVKATIEGTVIIAATYGKNGSYGKTVIIENKSQRVLMAHMSEIKVRPGDRVRPDTIVGNVGVTGNTTGSHLHYEKFLKLDGDWVRVDPGL